jgi:NAD(P)-dependent dehydrogenase (short-subunit alcohol dehydrogenase family)
MAVNLRHQFFLIQSVVPGMIKAGGGSVINRSSIAWMIPSTGLPVYVTAKAAIIGLTRTLAHELGVSNIRVNCVVADNGFHTLTNDVNAYSQLAITADGKTLATVLTNVDSSLAYYNGDGGKMIASTPLRITPARWHGRMKTAYS